MPVVVNSVSRKFGKLIALDNVTVKVRQGEIFVLAGPNGSGKSTLINIIIGFLKPHKGKVKVFGKSPFKLSPSERRNLGLLHESLGIPMSIRTSEYLESMAIFRGCGDVRDIVSQLEIKSVINKKIGTLSTGYRKRVALAAALVCNPRLVILDEPYSNIDPETRELIDNTLLNIKTKSTIIISSHIFPNIEEKFTIALLMNGKLIKTTRNNNIIVYVLNCGGNRRRVLDPAQATRLIRQSNCELHSARYATISELINKLK